MAHRMISTLKEARIEAGLTQEELAYRLDITRESIRNYESGKGIPNVFIALDIAKAVNKDVTELFKKL